MTNDYLIFNRAQVKQHRARAAAFIEGHFLLEELSVRMGDRLLDMTRTFPSVLNLGCHNGVLAAHLPERCGVETLVQADMSEAMVRSANGLQVVADEEFLPFAPASFDLVISVFSLQWVNDLPGCLIQINRILKPGGLFIAMMPGGESLTELRQSFEVAEMATRGGISPRISPFLDGRDGANLLQRAGFVLPVCDSEMLHVMYEHPLKLLQDLRAGGQGNALISGAKHISRRDMFAAMADYYLRTFSVNGRVTASCDIVTLTGWKKDAG